MFLSVFDLYLAAHGRFLFSNADTLVLKVVADNSVVLGIEENK